MQPLSRRRLLRLMPGIVPTAPWLAPDRRGPHAPPWRVALGLGGFAALARKRKTDLAVDEVLQFAARFHFEGVEIGPTLPAREGADALRRALDDRALAPVVLRIDASNAFSPQATLRAHWLDHVAHRLALARQLGCPQVCFLASGTLGGVSAELALFHLGESLRRACELAAKQGLSPSFELEDGSPFPAAHAPRILRAAEHRALGVAVELARFSPSALPPGDAEPVPSERVGYLRITKEDADVRALRRHGYAGWVVVETCAGADPFVTCARTKRMLEIAAL